MTEYVLPVSIGILVVSLLLCLWVGKSMLKMSKARKMPTLPIAISTSSVPGIILTNSARDIERVRQGGLTEEQVQSIIQTLDQAQHEFPPERTFVGRAPQPQRKRMN